MCRVSANKRHLASHTTTKTYLSFASAPFHHQHTKMDNNSKTKSSSNEAASVADKFRVHKQPYHDVKQQRQRPSFVSQTACSPSGCCRIDLSAGLRCLVCIWSPCGVHQQWKELPSPCCQTLQGVSVSGIHIGRFHPSDSRHCTSNTRSCILRIQ
jgi:hypothetical protein